MYWLLAVLRSGFVYVFFALWREECVQREEYSQPAKMLVPSHIPLKYFISSRLKNAQSRPGVQQFNTDKHCCLLSISNLSFVTFKICLFGTMQFWQLFDPHTPPPATPFYCTTSEKPLPP